MQPCRKDTPRHTSTDQMLDESLQGVDGTGAAALADAIEHN
jgi:hypothetical protein